MRARARLLAVASIALLIAAVAPITSATYAAADTTLMSCDESAFRAAVAAGGTVRFGVSCFPLVLTQTIVIPAGLDVTIDRNGNSVQLNGNQRIRQFEVDGGHLTLIGLNLAFGKV